MSVFSDHYTLRCEAERVVGEDRVPAEVLERLVADYGGRGPATPSRCRLSAFPAAALARARRRLAKLWPRRSRAQVPPAPRLDGVVAIEGLFNVVYDSELAMLEELVERAGLCWTCRAQVGGYPCNYVNVATATCKGCGAGAVK